MCRRGKTRGYFFLRPQPRGPREPLAAGDEVHPGRTPEDADDRTPRWGPSPGAGGRLGDRSDSDSPRLRRTGFSADPTSDRSRPPGPGEEDDERPGRPDSRESDPSTPSAAAYACPSLGRPRGGDAGSGRRHLVFPSANLPATRRPGGASPSPSDTGTSHRTPGGAGPG